MTDQRIDTDKCTHDYVDREGMIADGYCPLCMQSTIASLQREVERLKAEYGACRQNYEDTRLLLVGERDQARAAVGRLATDEFHRWAIKVSGPGLDWREIGSIAKTFVEEALTGTGGK